MTDRRDVLKLLAGAAAGLCPTGLSAASALASGKSAGGHGAAAAAPAKKAGGHGAAAPAKKAGAHGADPHWGYEDGATGPEHWGDLSPANRVCSRGFQQSPVDLTQGPDARLGGIDIDYRPMPLHVVNNGHTIQVNCEAGSAIRLDGSSYKLLQYHFHHPSEHALDGNRFQLEAHFVHVGDDGKLAVLGVFFQPGEENDALRTVWGSMPKKKGQEKKGGTVSPAALLPIDQTYYRYFGSLTTPPCSEKVIWSVFAQPLQASTAQVQEFADLFPMNARPLQPRHRRHLLKSS